MSKTTDFGQFDMMPFGSSTKKINTSSRSLCARGGWRAKDSVMIAAGESMKNASTVAVPLVGAGARNAPFLQNRLQKRGCDISFAASCKEAQKILRDRRHDLVLTEFLLSDGTAYELMSCLRGSDTTMFFSNTVEDGCWWLNAIYEGRDRSKEPGMRPAQFKIVLEATSCSIGFCRKRMNLRANRVRIAATICPPSQQQMKERRYEEDQF